MTARTLLLTLAGAQQSWGSRSRFATRGTERAPTRSGVLGLIAAALGLERTDPLDRFDELRFGVRIDQPGSIERDFQTARTLDGRTSMPLSQRYYLADAVFVAGLESADDALLDDIHAALRQPQYPLYLGRRAFPPAGPIATEIVELSLRDALRDAPWRASSSYRKSRKQQPALELVLDALPGEVVHASHQDVPRSFDPRRRQHDWRDVTIESVSPPGDEGVSAPAAPSHDPLLLVSEEEL